MQFNCGNDLRERMEKSGFLLKLFRSSVMFVEMKRGNGLS